MLFRSVVIDGDAIMAADPVTAKDIEAAYEQRRSQYEVKEQRQASHILIAVKQGATDADKAKARARAEDLLAQAKKNPAGFADLARKNSDDPGSAEKGGDVGLFSRGLIAKAFEDAAFSMKPGDISGPVETEFGYHVIRLTSVVPGKTRPLSEVRSEIEKDLQKQRAGRKARRTIRGECGTCDGCWSREAQASSASISRGCCSTRAWSSTATTG